MLAPGHDETKGCACRVVKTAAFSLTMQGTGATTAPQPTEDRMAKGEQRSNKMAKKPKKDTSPPKTSTSDRPMPPVTAVIPRGKEKNK